MDQGALLECFRLHSINDKVVSKQKTKNGIIAKYGHCKRNSIKKEINYFSVILQCFLSAKSSSKSTFCESQQNLPSRMHLTAGGYVFCSSIDGRTIITSECN